MKLPGTHVAQPVAHHMSGLSDSMSDSWREVEEGEEEGGGGGGERWRTMVRSPRARLLGGS